MTRYIAFLRGINVGGHKIIKMEYLSRIFTSLAFKNVKTFIQSGNIIFETSGTNPASLTKKIEKRLHKSLGYEVSVFLRTIPEVADIVRWNPFRKIKSNADIKTFVTFLSEEPTSKPKLPLISSKEKIEVIHLRNRQAFILCRRKKNGWFGFPNDFIEKELEVVATTRSWTTISKIIRL